MITFPFLADPVPFLVAVVLVVVAVCRRCPPSPTMPAQQSSSPAQVAGVVSFYMSAALVMVFVNKAVLNSSPDLPLLFLFFQMLIAVGLLHLTAAIFPSRVDLPKLSSESAKKLAPVITVNIVGLIFNTLCLRDVDASFFQIARGMVLPMTIAASSLTTKSTPSVRVIMAAGIVTFGFLLGISPASIMPSVFSASTTSAIPPSVSFLSLFYGLLSSLFIAVHSVLIKSSLPHCSGSTIHLAYWTNLGSAVFVAPLVLIKGEPWRVIELLETRHATIGAVEVWNVRVFAVGSLVTGLFGFLLCVAGLLSIKVTSPITHMFSSVSLNFLLTFRCFCVAFGIGYISTSFLKSGAIGRMGFPLTNISLSLCLSSPVRNRRIIGVVSICVLTCGDMLREHIDTLVCGRPIGAQTIPYRIIA